MKASSEICEVMWHTEMPAHEEPCMITVQNGASRYVLPECKYSPKTKRWYHLIIDRHTRPVDDPEVYEITIDEEWERVTLPVVAWAEYPEAYTGELCG